MYDRQLRIQFENLNRPALRVYFNYLYSLISEHIKIDDRLLEIGAGSGSSIKFLADFNVLRTDYLDSNKDLVMCGVNAENLPFDNDSFDAVIAVDMIHHLADPKKGIQESLRVCKSNGIVLIVEPYISLLSYPIYKLFHPEDTSIPFRPEKVLRKMNSDPSNGDQTILQCLINSEWFKSESEKLDSSFEIEQLTRFSILSFFATGGINNPLPTPAFIIKIAIKLEALLPQCIHRFFASRQILILRKNYS